MRRTKTDVMLSRAKLSSIIQQALTAERFTPHSSSYSKPVQVNKTCLVEVPVKCPDSLSMYCFVQPVGDGWGDCMGWLIS